MHKKVFKRHKILDSKFLHPPSRGVVLSNGMASALCGLSIFELHNFVTLLSLSSLKSRCFLGPKLHWGHQSNKQTWAADGNWKVRLNQARRQCCCSREGRRLPGTREAAPARDGLWFDGRKHPGTALSVRIQTNGPKDWKGVSTIRLEGKQLSHSEYKKNMPKVTIPFHKLTRNLPFPVCISLHLFQICNAILGWLEIK